MLGAIDASAIILALDGIVKHPLVGLIIKSAPVLFGVTVAAYVESVGAFVRRVATAWWFVAIVVVVFVVAVIPEAWGVSVPLVIPVGTRLVLDDSPVVADSLAGDTIQALSVKGLRRHTLAVAYYDVSKQDDRVDVFGIGPKQLLSAGWWQLRGTSKDHPFDATILAPVLIDHEATANLVEIRGPFSPLFLEAAHGKFYVERNVDALGSRVWFPDTKGSTGLAAGLPPGHYAARAYSATRHCWSPLAPFDVARYTFVAVSVDSTRCATS